MTSAHGPTTLSLGRGRTVVEMKNLWRNRQAFGFTVLFPVMMLLLFASIFGGTIDGTDVETSRVYVAGIMGSALMSTAFVSLAIGISMERESGMLKRLAGTPMPKTSYFLGKIGMVLVTVAIQTVVLLALGVGLFDVTLPTAPSAWLTFTWVFVLGVTASTLLGIAIGSLIKDAKSGPAVVNLPFVALQFISGVWITVNQLPKWLITVSQVFPLHWICRGMRAVFLPDSFKVVETGGSWQLGTGALVLGAWCVIGFVVCAKTFRWTRG
ncbi:MAG: ABC transporter permease [Ilumatobacteraceae bacterium]